MNEEEYEPELIITEIKALLNAAWNTPNDYRYETLLAWSRELLKPLVVAQ